jgi:hypothetical protein
VEWNEESKLTGPLLDYDARRAEPSGVRFNRIRTTKC